MSYGDAKDLQARMRYVEPELTNPFTWPTPHRFAAVLATSNVLWRYVMNVYYKRPWYGALGKTVATSAALAAVGYAGGLFRDYHYSTRDALIDHYQQLHPEDFEFLNTQTQRKYRDVFLPWFPVRTQQRFREDKHTKDGGH